MGDLRQALRFLWSHRSFSAVAVLTLAVGLGANAALFGFVDVALRPLAVPDAGRIVTIAAETRDDLSGGFQYAFSNEAFQDLQERTEAFDDVFGMVLRIGGLTSDDGKAQFYYAPVSENYFQALQLAPHLGRLFTERSGSPPSLVLGYSFWMRHFGGDPNVIGRTVQLDGRPAVVTGVVPPSFRGTLMAIELDGYVAIEDFRHISPGSEDWLYDNRRAKPIVVFGRLKQDVSLPEADADVKRVMTALEAEFPETDAGVTARVVPEPLARPIPMRAVSDSIPIVRLFSLSIAALVLFLACLNVANLLLVRATMRQRELAVRAALGASRGRLVRQMVAEGLVLSLLGGIAGLALGQIVTHLFVSRIDIGADMPFALDTTFHWPVFLYSLIAAVITGTAIGVWPAWKASRADARAALHDGGRAHSDGVDRQRIRQVLVVGQIAGSLALLVVAGLFVRSLGAAEQVDLGFDADRLITVRLDTRHVSYDEDESNAFYDELLRRVREWPEVERAALAFSVPMTYLVGGGAFYVEGRPDTGGQPPVTFFNHVGRDYFRTMGIPIVSGQAFTDDDLHQTSDTRRIVIVNETLADQFWPGEDPIGKRLRLYEPDSPPLEVVGVAKDSKYVLIFEAPRPFLYVPLVRDSSLRTLHVRTPGNPALLANRIEREVAALAPDMPLADLRTIRQSMAGLFGYLIFRLGAAQAGGMGLVGLALAIIGVYGVVSFGASLRTREIGIRLALGAQRRDVLELILGQGLLLVGIGLVIGLAAAAGLSRVLAAFLPLVDAKDWTTYGLVATALGVLALWACYLPARRATRISAMNALRHE